MADIPMPLQDPRPAIAASIAACGATTAEQVQAAFLKIKLRLASTRFKSARASQICGLIQLEMDGGKTAYADLNGRFFILGLALDTQTGSPADAQTKVDRILVERDAALQGHSSINSQ